MRSDRHFRDALTLFQAGKLVDAERRFTHALSINPNIAETWNSRGLILNELRRRDEALVDFDKAIELKPHYAEAFYNKATCLTELGRYDEALAAYDKAL